MRTSVDRLVWSVPSEVRRCLPKQQAGVRPRDLCEMGYGNFRPWRLTRCVPLHRPRSRRRVPNRLSPAHRRPTRSAPQGRAQQSPAHGPLNVPDRGHILCAGRVKNRPPGRIGLEHTIHHHAVEVQMGVQERAKAVDEEHSAEPGRCTGAGTVLPQNPRDGGQENEVSAQANLRSRLSGTAAAAAKMCRRRLAPQNRAPGGSADAWAPRAPTGAPAKRAMTWSARCAAVSTMRRVVQDGQTPLHLQDQAMRKSCPQSAQRARAKPWARMPQSRMPQSR